MALPLFRKDVWDRASALVAEEYGSALPAARRHALVTAVAGLLGEMTLSGATGGFRDAPLPVVTPGGSAAPGRPRARPKKRAVAEDLPLSNIITPLPDGELHIQDGEGWETQDSGAQPEHSEWQKAGYIAAGSLTGKPVGMALIAGKRHAVYRHGKKLRAHPVRESVDESVPFTPQAIAAALGKLGVPLASRGERHEVSGVQVLKVGDGVGWRWEDHAGAGDRHTGQLTVQAALESLGLRTHERRAGDGAFVILPPDHVDGPRESAAPIHKTIAAIRRIR